MHLLQVLPSLVRRGLEVRVQTLTNRGELADQLEHAGVNVLGHRRSTSSIRSRNLLARAARLLRAVASITRILVAWRPDVVHFFLPSAYLVGAPCAILFSRAKRAMSRRSLDDYQRERPLLARVERQLHYFMHGLCGNSAAIIKQLAAEGAPLDRLHLIYNGVDLSRFPLVEQKPRDSDHPLTFLIVANLIAYKGHADLIDAFALARKRLPPWRLVCAGRDDGIGSTLRARAAAAEIATEIQFVGNRSDIPELMRQADVAVLSSHQEGFPNAVIEAMAAGLPVVATAVGGVIEAVIHGETGFLVPIRDPSAMAEALVTIARDATLRKRFGEQGRAVAQRRFALDTCADAYISFYRRL